MRFAFTTEEQDFRTEVRSFIETEWQGDAAGLEGAYDFSRKLAERRWLCSAWPVDLGGAGFSLIQQAIFNEEIGYHLVEEPFRYGTHYAGPAIIVFGTEEQKQKFLPGIAGARDIWWQCFTEPNAGSDLASLQTRAVRDGDMFVLNGTKIFVGDEQEPDYLYLPARTDPDSPKHRGISLFVVPARTPGITITPLVGINGRIKTQIFFDDVRVDADAMVGEENRGWYHIATTLDFERSGVSGNARGRRYMDAMKAAVQASPRLQKRMTPSLRLRFAELESDLRVGRLLAWRVAWQQSQGRVPNHEASMSSLFSKLWSPRFAEALLELYGDETLLIDEDGPLGGFAAREFLSSRSLHPGGTVNIQRNIIATRGLGLPRSA
ncbi:MAG: acyl-CoA dehydrogenase family protein [Dehalococcoidia bacterium]